MLSSEIRAARVAALRYRRANDPVAAARRAAMIYAGQRGTAGVITVARCALQKQDRKLAVSRSSTKAEVKVDGDTLTFPVVAFVEGIRQPANSGGPELFLKSEFEPALPSAIGMPVVFNHPQITDEFGFVWYPSVGHPGPFDPGTGMLLGHVADGRFDGDRMILDVSLSLARIAAAGSDARAMGRALFEGGNVEVSLGHWSNVLPIGGFWPDSDGQPYFGVHTDIEFDHLALLELGQEGACSTARDGCGAVRD